MGTKASKNNCKGKSIGDAVDVGDKPIRITKSEYQRYLVYPYNRHASEKHADAKARTERAFEFAIETRKFEIEMYWKRATYFWAFTTVTFGGYIALIRSEKSATFEVFLLICIGLIVSCAWHLTNIGSKSWQRHWEKHLDLLEDQFMGPIYKTVNINKTFSVSKINEIVSVVFIVAWSGLGIHHLFKQYYLTLENINIHDTVFVTLSVAVVVIAVWQMLRGKGRGRFKAQEIEMYKRGYMYSYDGKKTQDD